MMKWRNAGLATMAMALIAGTVSAQPVVQSKGNYIDKFRQLDESLPTANVYRNAAGQPGHAYWQQQVDYDIQVTLDETGRRLSGSETIRYENNSCLLYTSPSPRDRG